MKTKFLQRCSLWILLTVLTILHHPCISKPLEFGDFILRDFDPFGVNVGHAAIYCCYLTKDADSEYTAGDWVIESNSSDGVTFANWEGFLGTGNQYWGSRTHKTALSQVIRYDLIENYAKWQINAEYGFFGLLGDWMKPNSSWQSGDGKFRCDGLVEYCYRQVNRSIESSNNKLWNSGPRHLYNHDNARSSRYETPSKPTMTMPSSTSVDSPTSVPPTTSLYIEWNESTDETSGLGGDPYLLLWSRWTGNSWTPWEETSFTWPNRYFFECEPGTYYAFYLKVYDAAGNSSLSDVYYLYIQPIIRSIDITGDLNFGDVVVDDWDSRTMTIWNLGNTSLTVNSISYPNGFSGNWGGGTIKQGGSRDVKVYFEPGGMFSYGGEIAVYSDASSGDNIIQCSGIGIKRDLDITGNLSFGNVPVLQSANKTMTLWNEGNRKLRIDSIIYPAGFSGDWNGGTISGNSSREVTVTFHPELIQEYNGVITVNSNKTHGTDTRPCSGNGIPSATVATPTFSPDGGAYRDNSLNVTIFCSTQGATIHYTTDGSDPTTSSPTVVSGNSVQVPVPGKLKAKAWKDLMNPSEIKTAGYTLIVSDFDYTISDNKVTITGYLGDDVDITIPSKIEGYPVTSIGRNVFFPNFGITSITIPSSVINISWEAFNGCSDLLHIFVASSNPVYSSADGVLFDRGKYSIMRCPGGKSGNYQIPDSVISIIGWAFYFCRNLSNVTIPNSVTSIGWGAFDGCINLKSVIIGAGVTSIGRGVFDGCGSLAGIYFAGSPPELGEEYFDAVDAQVFYISGTGGWGETFGGLPVSVWTTTATFDGNGGTPSYGTRNYNAGKAYGELPTASRAGYLFDGWWTISGDTRVSGTTLVPLITTGHTLHAKWVADGVPPSGPSGSEGAVDFGTVPNTDNPPPEGCPAAWVLKAPLSWRADSGIDELWYKFTGEESRRYLLAATGTSEGSSAAGFTIEFYASDGTVPLDPVLKTVEFVGWDALDRGIWLDSPTGSKKNQLYFLRISRSVSVALSCSLRLHQMGKDPAVGSVTNPYYTGAVLGKWTMNAEAARTAAQQNKKPVIFYFTGVHWCPYCVGTEHTAFASTAFNTALNDAYLVVVDNRRRDGTGSSLLRESFDGGYLTENGITTQDANDKLTANLDLQDELAWPGAPTFGASNKKRIGYPTFVYCRVQANSRSESDFQPIGRFSYNDVVLPFAADALDKILQLKALDGAGYREISMFSETSQLILVNSPFPSYIGGVVTSDWVKFTVDEGKSFLATIVAQASSSAAEVDLKVYKEDGKTLLKRVSGKLQDGSTSLEYMPPNAEGGTFWLSVSAVKQSTAVPYQLTYEQKQLKNQVFFSQTEIPIAKSDTNVTLTLKRRIRSQDSKEPFAMQYRVVPGTAAAAWFVSAYTWQNVYWTEDEKTLGQKELTVHVTVPQDAPPQEEGYWDFRVALRVTDGVDSWEISQESAEGGLVKIYSKAVFALNPDLRTLQLYTGIPSTIIIPICRGGRYDLIWMSGDSTPGLNVIFPTAEDSFVKLSWNPQQFPDDIELPYSTEITLGLVAGEDETDRLTLSILIQEMKNDLVNKSLFAGILHPEGQSVATPLGSLSLIKSEEDGKMTATVLSKDSPELVVFGPTVWGYDPQTEELLLEFPDMGSNSLSLRLSPGGIGMGYYRTANGEYSLSFFPVTEKPAEFTGYYTVPLRIKDDNRADESNFALGWLLLTIDDTGKAAYSGEMEDGTIFSGDTWVYHQDGDAFGTVAFFAYLTDTATRTEGARVAGLLSVAPENLRSPYAINDACISDCGSTSVWVKNDASAVGLFPCGTTYDSTKTLQVQSGSESSPFYLYVETRFPVGNTAIVPNRVTLKEDGANLNNVSPAKGFGTQYSALSKGPDGVFSGTVDVLVPGQDGLVTITVDVRGVLSPVTSDCCSIGSDLYVGYGFYRLDDKVYSIRLSSNALAAPQIPTPELLALGDQTKVPFNCIFVADSVQATISNPTGWLIYQKLSDQTWYSAFQGGDLVTTLATASQWKIVALDGETMAESGILEIPLQKAQAVQTFSLTGGEGSVQLHTGWNLIGVPWNVQPAADMELPAGLFAHDAERKIFVTASKLTTGSAYWLFVRDDFESFTLLGETLDQGIVSELAAGSWNFLAWPSTESTLDHVWRWDGAKFIYVDPSAPTDGVWGYKEPVQ